jgi:chemotaxis-related protein WspD
MMQPAPGFPSACWKVIGIEGDLSCAELQNYIHCRNCPIFSHAGRSLLDREMPADYRDELTLRLAQKADHQDTDSLRLIIFRVASLWLALPAVCFEESLSPVAVSPVPMRSNRQFLGLVNTGGELQLCFTLEHHLVAEADESAPTCSGVGIFPRFLVLKLGGRKWVITADEVQGAISVPRQRLEALPPNLLKSPQKLMLALFRLNDLEVKLLDEARLLSFLQEALA